MTKFFLKVWRDLKFKVKKKLVTNKAECTSTGGGIYKQHILSPLEESVANLLQFQKQLNPEGTIQGVQLINCENVDIEALESTDLVLGNENDIEILGPSTSSQSVKKGTPLKGIEKSKLKKPGPCNDHYELLQKHSDEQAQILKEINNSISSMKRSLKDLSSHQKDLLNIEKKKHQLMLEENERQKEQHDAEMKIKRIKLLIKEKELHVLDIG